MQPSNESHYYQDTLWVRDSSHRYKYVSTTDQLALQQTYRVLSRNDTGKYLVYEYLVDKNYPFPELSGGSSIDSINYFDGENIENRTRWTWISEGEIWVKNYYNEYLISGLPVEKYTKGFESYNLNRRGYREKYINSNNKLDTLFYYDYIPESDSWKLVSKTLSFYDENDNDTLLVVYKNYGSLWLDSLKIRQSFELDKMVQKTTYNFNSSTNHWDQEVLDYFHYTISGEYDTVTKKNWDSLTNSWVSVKKNIYYYDNQGKTIGFLLMKFSAQTQMLENYYRESIEQSSDIEIKLSEFWDLNTNDFINNWIEYSFINSDMLVDSILLKVWNNNILQWEDFLYSTYKFNTQKHLKEASTSYYNENTWSVESRIISFWSPFIPNSINEISTNALAVYPNPASNQVTFALADILPNQDQQISIKIFNIRGQKISEIPLKEDKVIWDCSYEKSGIYVYSAVVDGLVFTGKIIVK
jgi:hypothetical protein